MYKRQGLGTCARVCPFDAIHVDPVKKIAVVDDEKCVACGKCVAIYPKGVLSLRPVTEDVTVAASLLPGVIRPHIRRRWSSAQSCTFPI